MKVLIVGAGRMSRRVRDAVMNMDATRTGNSDLRSITDNLTLGSVDSVRALGATLRDAEKMQYRKVKEPPRLLYKNWLTIKEWLREMYISRVYLSLKKWDAIINHVFSRRTVKSTSPIVRNKAGGRA